MSDRRILGPPHAQRQLARGIAQLTDVLRLTLGPTTNRIAIAGSRAVQSPELLDDASVLSQRILELPNPFEDIGLQCLRKALTDLSERTHDGAATCSVLTRAILREAAPLVAFGHHTQSILDGLRAGVEWVSTELQRQAWSIDAPAEIRAVVQTATGDTQLAAMIAEILDTIGPEGSLLVEETRHPGIDHEYVQGARWSNGHVSPALVDGSEVQTVARSPVILVSAAPLRTTAQVVPLLECVAKTASRSLVLIAPDYSDEVIGVLFANRQQQVVNTVIAVKPPSSIHFGPQILEDISILVGGRLILKEDPSALQSLALDDLGRANRAWATRSAFGIVGGAGDREAIRQRVQAIRSQARAETDALRKSRLSERAGNLAGLSAIVRVERQAQSSGSHAKRNVEKAATVGRLALQHGVVAGGGAALARSAPNLCERFKDGPEHIGAMVLARALSEPMRVIVENAGLPAGPVLNHLQSVKPNQAFNVLTERWENCAESGLVDALTVVTAALDVAVSTTMMVLSTDVLVRGKQTSLPPVG